MIAKKICMLGAFSVGKTSLVEHYVHAHFSEEYLSTVGVRISKKQISNYGPEVSLVFWDMEGKDDYSDVSLSYLRGSAGVFFVADGLRRETLTVALDLHAAAAQSLYGVAQILLINKADRRDQWEITEKDQAAAEKLGLKVFLTSAKTGENVDAAFDALAGAMLAP